MKKLYEVMQDDDGNKIWVFDYKDLEGEDISDSEYERIFNLAFDTGEKQLLSQWGKDEGVCHRWAMPDGTIETTRHPSHYL